MDPIAKQILWIVVFLIGLGLQALPELSEKLKELIK